MSEITSLIMDGVVKASVQGTPPTLQAQGLSPDTLYNSKIRYEKDGNVIESSVQGIRTLPAGTFSVSNTYIENDASTGHAILTFDFLSTYAISSIQVRYSGVDYQGSISGGKCTVELPTGLQYTSITFDINAIDIYAETFRVGQTGVYVEEAMSKQPFFVSLIDPSENRGNVQIIKYGSPTSLTLEYSMDGSNWNTYTMGDFIPLTSSKPRVWFRNNDYTKFSTGIGNYYLVSPAGMSVGGAEVGGNIASLKARDLYNFTSKDYDFCKLFATRTSIGKADRLYLGNYMTLTKYCYNEMFNGCTSLEKAPELPATTLASWCYGYMFNGCTSLREAPKLPATTLANYCYDSMFLGCTSLEKAHELPATTLANSCYDHMFYGCTSLEKAPVLPATMLVEYCYNNMFSYCTNLKEITCLAEDISTQYCVSQWVNGVAQSGTFTKSPNMSSWPTGNSGIPSGWTVQDYQ